MTAASNATPELSVVVCVTSGGEHVERCLAALAEQRGAPALEIVVPIDGWLPKADTARWRQRFASARWIEIEIEAAARADGVHHGRFDQRRAAGLAAARAPIVALTEDHAVPDPDWCRNIARAHAARAHPAIGGAIDNASSQRLARAVHLCDFGRYQSPLQEGPADYASDVNVSYKRSALEAVRSHWRAGYHETAVHDALRARGELLWLDPSVRILQLRGRLGFRASLRERYAWGRWYAGKRCNEIGPGRRAVLALLSPLLPILLLARQLRATWLRRRAQDAALLPLVALLFCAWGLGEAAGYWTGRPDAGSARRT